jgi:hypothetical protein
VSNLAYYLIWLAAGLTAVAIASAAIALRLKSRVMRRVKASELLDALTRYSGWLAAQRAAAFFPDDTDAPPLAEIAAIGRQWFPDLSGEMTGVLAVHERVLAFSSAQKRLRLQDPEAWLELDHEARFAELWREHLRAVQMLDARLRLATAAEDAGARQAGKASPA